MERGGLKSNVSMPGNGNAAKKFVYFTLPSNLK